MKLLCLAAVLAGTAVADEPVGTVIGIDLGTTYSCVGVYVNGRVEIIANDQGNRITPSVVSFSDGDRLIGEAAKNQAALNPTNTVYDAKRLIGRKYADSTVQKDKRLLPFEIIDKDTKPYIEVEIKGERKSFAPEEISAMVLLKMKETAEAYLGKDVKNAVVTVPGACTFLAAHARQARPRQARPQASAAAAAAPGAAAHGTSAQARPTLSTRRSSHELPLAGSTDSAVSALQLTSTTLSARPPRMLARSRR